MEHIFYFFAIFFIIYEAIWILNPEEQIEINRKITEGVKANKGKKLEDYSQEHKDFMKQIGVRRMFTGFLIVFWMFSGLLTFNWVAFLLFIILNFAIVAPISKFYRDKKGGEDVYLKIHWVNSLIGFAFGIFILTNKYHLRIDLQEWFLTLLN